jgi:hypothetical protein
MTPKQDVNFDFTYKKSDIIKLSYKAVYDNKSFYSDINRINSIKENRDREIRFWKAFFVFIDELWFNGKILSYVEVFNVNLMLYRGVTKEQYANLLYDYAVDLGIDKITNKSFERALAKSAYELAKSIEPKEYSDLQRALTYYMNKRDEKYEVVGKITDTAKLPNLQPNNYPFLSLSGSYLINQNFTEFSFNENKENISILGERYNNQNPIELRMAIMTCDCEAYVFEFARSNVFINPNLQDFNYIKSNAAARFTSYSFGISQAVQFLEIVMGITYLKQDNFLIEPTSNMLQANGHIFKWGGFFEPRVNIPIGRPITLFGAWRASMFRDKSIKETMLVVSNFKVGVSLNFTAYSLNYFAK